MVKRPILVRLTFLATFVGLAGCGGTAPPSFSTIASPSGDAEIFASLPPGALLSPDGEAPASPKASLKPPRPTPSSRRPLVRWAKTPQRIFNKYCASIVATVDGASRFHVAAVCEGAIAYANSIDGRTWKTSSFGTAREHFDVDPQLAVDGTTLYLAFTRLRPIEQDTCGGRAVQEDAAGIFYLERTLPGGRWSAPKRIGQEGDHLQSFRVANGVIHETFITDDSNGPVSYASVKGSTSHEIRIPGAQSTSLRLGDDGRPRIAFTSGNAIRYAVVSGGNRIASTTVFTADDVLLESPVLVLGSGDHAYASWAALPAEDFGCEGPPPPTHVGTWFATDVGGAWATKRLSKDVGSASLALDVATGRLHATYNDQRGIRYVTRSPDGTWSGSRLEVPKGFLGSVLRRDPASGRLLLVGSMFGDDEKESGTYAVTAS